MHSASACAREPDGSIALQQLRTEIDTANRASEHSGTQVTLAKDLEDFVARKVEKGGYVNASEVVRDALRNFRAQEDPAEIDSSELADMLLPAVQGRHRPLTAKNFDRLRSQARRHGSRK